MLALTRRSLSYRHRGQRVRQRGEIGNRGNRKRRRKGRARIAAIEQEGIVNKRERRRRRWFPRGGKD